MTKWEMTNNKFGMTIPATNISNIKWENRTNSKTSLVIERFPRSPIIYDIKKILSSGLNNYFKESNQNRF